VPERLPGVLAGGPGQPGATNQRKEPIMKKLQVRSAGPVRLTSTFSPLYVVLFGCPPV
jgi:hypothetical protein